MLSSHASRMPAFAGNSSKLGLMKPLAKFAHRALRKFRLFNWKSSPKAGLAVILGPFKFLRPERRHPRHAGKGTP